MASVPVYAPPGGFPDGHQDGYTRPMVDILAQVVIPYRSGIPEDVAVNTWSFDVADDDETNLGQIGQFLNVFYSGIDSLLSPVLDLGLVRGKFYRRSDPEPRTPVLDEVFDLGDGNTGGVFPEEVAACLSFRGVLQSGEPAARRRGRVYLGPLSDNVLVGDGQLRSRMPLAVRTTILDAYEAAWGELTTAGNVHTVWSSADATRYPVVQAWVDDAFDTQRRRGPAATTRTTRNGPF